MTDLRTTQDVYAHLRAARSRPLVQPIARDLSNQVFVDEACSLMDMMLEMHWASFHTLPSADERNAMRDAAWVMATDAHGVTHVR